MTRTVGIGSIGLFGALALLLPVPSAVQAAEVKVVSVARGLVNPWSLAFLPDGRMLVTERPGRLRIIDPKGRVGAAVRGLPPVVAQGQGGLLDVVIDPQYAQNGWVYWSYSEPGAGGTSSTAVARGKLQGDQMIDVKVVFRQLPKVAGRFHFGSRLVFAPDGRLFVTLGDRFSYKDDAQTLANHMGKIVRIEPDGAIPRDNPFADTPGAKPEIWSVGHRNVQGAAINPTSGELFTTEHGPQGGDELNLIKRGGNYGWPLVTYGRNYMTGIHIGEEGPKPGIELPLIYWVPTSIAPSGLAFLTSGRYPGWKGNLFLGALRGQALVRIELDGPKVVKQQRLLQTLNERIRDVRQGPDGWLYVLTDSADGRVLRLQR